MIDIDKLIKEAIIEKNEAKKDAYKLIKAELMLIQTGTNGQKPRPVVEVDIINITKKLIKIKEKDIEMYTEGLKNPNLDDSTFRKRKATLINYTNQIKYLNNLLPHEISNNKIQEAVMTAYPNGYSQKEMGKVIKEIKSIYPTADGKLISEIVREHII